MGNPIRKETGESNYNALKNQKKSLLLVRYLEALFKRIGHRVSSHPFSYIIGSILVTLLCSLGFLRFNPESRPQKLWIPSDADYVKALEWKEENFHAHYRRQMTLMESENILDPSVISEMRLLQQEVTDIEVLTSAGEVINKDRKCLRIPELGKIKDNWLVSLLRTDNSTSRTDWSLILDTDSYCQIYNALPTTCFELSILDMWTEDYLLKNTLTQADIIEAVNTVTTSAKYGFPLDFTRLLGEITRNETGHVVSAKTALSQWIMAVDRSSSSAKNVMGAGLESEVDEGLYLWEGKFLETAVNSSTRTPGVYVYPQAQRSFSEVSSNAIMEDVRFLVVGNIMLYVYVFIMLGKCNMVETRPFLSFLGFLSIGISVISAFGVCSALGIIYAPLHSILPLILLGLGVDDMFVLVQSWETQDKTKYKSLEDRLPATLQKAGLAIFVTSLTDVLAFIIGSFTSLPSLRSFCIYAAVGVAFLFITQITFFFACFTLDQRRMEANRNGFFWCIQHNNIKKKFWNISLTEKVFTKFSNILLQTKTKVFIMLLTVVMTGFAIWGVTNLRQEFNPIWFIPQSSYLYNFISKALKYYPEAGSTGMIFMEKSVVSTELSKVEWLTQELEQSTAVSRVESWYTPLQNYTMERSDIDISMKNINDTFSSEILGNFLFSSTGARFFPFFSFGGRPTCGQNVPPLHATMIRYTHEYLNDRDAQIEAMDEVKNIVKRANFSGFASPMAPSYCGWEGDKIISYEVAQNLSLALLAVFIMTSLLLANIIASFLVFTCVLLTVMDVMALMSIWGLTIDMVTCINLVLCVGLSVDYSAHIALHFMKVTGTRNQRAKASLTEIGPAVFHGAFSTFLTFVLLSNSDSHVFLSFFKIFVGVFVFGIYQGLIFLPVALSIIGPPAYNLGSNAVLTEEAHKLPENSPLKPLS